MLNIEYGSYQKLYDKYGEDFIYDPDMYFNNTYDEKWITSDIARKIIKDIDKNAFVIVCDSYETRNQDRLLKNVKNVKSI